MKSIDSKSVIIGVLGTLIVTLLLGAAGNKKTLEVKTLKLVNDKGETCGILTAAEDGRAFMSLGGKGFGENAEKFTVSVNPNGKVQGGNVKLGIGGKRGYMSLTNDYSNAGPLIYMVNAQGKLAFAAGLWGKNGEGYIRIDDYDPKQKGVSGKKNVMDKIDKKSFMVIGNEGEVLWSAPNK